MDSMNVLIMYKSRTFRLLVPIGRKYAELVDTISVEIKIDRKTIGLKIEYEVDENLSPIRITNDTTLRVEEK